MTWLDVVRVKGGALAVICQSDRLSQLSTRFTVPLLDPEALPSQISGLHPEFIVAGQRWIMATHLAGAIPARMVEATIGSLQDEEYVIQRALDLMISGY